MSITDTSTSARLALMRMAPPWPQAEGGGCQTCTTVDNENVGGNTILHLDERSVCRQVECLVHQGPNQFKWGRSRQALPRARHTRDTKRARMPYLLLPRGARLYIL